MKKLMLVFVVLMPNLIMAQKLNDNGEKMVSKITIEQYVYTGASQSVYCTIDRSFEFGYDNRRLSSANIMQQRRQKKKTRDNEVHESKYQMNNKGKLTRKEYVNNKELPGLAWSYMVDNFVVTKIEEYSYDNTCNSSALRHDITVAYECGWDGLPTLSSIASEDFHRNRAGEAFVKSGARTDRLVEYYNYDDGNYNVTKGYESTFSNPSNNNTEGKFTYEPHTNDTNMNWLALVYNYAQRYCTTGADASILPLTEWMPSKTKCLPSQMVYGNNYKFSYVYEGGNITTIEITRNGIMWMRVKVEYVK